MNRLILIGNGFDLAHDLKTSYKDFINWYWDQRLKKIYIQEVGNLDRIKDEDKAEFEKLLDNGEDEFKDPLCKLKLDFKDLEYIQNNFDNKYENKIRLFSDYKSFLKNLDPRIKGGATQIAALDFIAYTISKKGKSPIDDIDLSENLYKCIIPPKEYPLMASIIKSVKEKGWTDIEKDYYELLKETLKDDCKFTAKQLNNQLHFLQEKLIEYLKTLHITTLSQNIEGYIKEEITPEDISEKDKKEVIASVENIFEAFKKTQEYEKRKIYFRDDYIKWQPQRTLLLNFNYTETTSVYKQTITYNENYLEEIHIHGSLKKPENIIFGYGDELDKDYNEIIDKNDNRLLDFFKSVKYLETMNYRRLQEFLESDYFQVYIMGHSCGNSDRTLLNTIFEHENCVSIKPFYHEWEENGEKKNNYLDIVQNIYRNFTNLNLYRDRVVPKERCEPLK